MSDGIVLHLETDPDQREWYTPLLRQYGEVLSIPSEYAFREAVTGLARSHRLPARLALLDMVVLWSEPAKEIPERPVDVGGGGMRYAGARCGKFLLESEETFVQGGQHTPLIMIAALDESYVRMAMRSVFKDSVPRYKFIDKTDLTEDAFHRAVSEALGSGFIIA